MPWRLTIYGALALLLVDCTTPFDVGERYYREGDRLAALETWRRIPPDDPRHEAAHARIEAVEQEFQQLVVRYKQRGRYFEARGRLAESILNYRLALKLELDDRETLAHVQQLSRTLAAIKRETLEAFREDLDQRELGPASEKLTTLRRLDPFDTDLETERRQFNLALREEILRQLARGRGSFTTGDLREARAAFRYVLELDPHNESAQGYLSYIAALRAGGGTSSVGSFDPSQVFASQEEIRAEGFYQNALAAERAGDPYAAIRHDLSALAANPEHEESRAQLARIRSELQPEVETLIESGRGYYLREDLQSALDQWRRALLIDPGNERASEYVERANRLLENLERLRSDPQPGVR